MLDGSAGDMTAVAGSGHQTLFGGPGDTLTAGSGIDTFMFAPNFGNETINNFQPHDIIELPTSLFASFHDVKDSMVTRRFSHRHHLRCHRHDHADAYYSSAAARAQFPFRVNWRGR